MGEPIGFEIGEAGLCCAGAGDGDEVALGIGEMFSVSLEAGAEAAADAISVVGFFRGALAGNKCSTDSGQCGIGQGADNDKPACFRLAGFSDTKEILALVDALFSRETHGSGVPERQAGKQPRRCRGGPHLLAVLRDVTLEVKLCAFRDQALTTFLTAAFDTIASSLGGHTGAETVLLFTGTFGGLVSAEAHGGFFGE